MWPVVPTRQARVTGVYGAHCDPLEIRTTLLGPGSPPMAAGPHGGPTDHPGRQPDHTAVLLLQQGAGADGACSCARQRYIGTRTGTAASRKAGVTLPS